MGGAAVGAMFGLWGVPQRDRNSSNADNLSTPGNTAAAP